MGGNQPAADATCLSGVFGDGLPFGMMMTARGFATGRVTMAQMVRGGALMNAVSVVLITHRLQDLFEVADRFVVLYEGVNHRQMKPSEPDLGGLVTAMMGK